MDPRVRDAFAVGEGPDAVVWVVPTGAVRAEALSALLREHLGPTAPEVALLDALPRLPSGDVDREALARMEAPVSARLARLEASLRQRGVEAVGVAGPWAARESFTPLDALLPAELLPRPRAAASVAAPRAVSAGDSGGPLSFLDGGPRRAPPGSPTTLVELLRQAIARTPEQVFTFIDVDGRRETLPLAALWDEALRLWSGLLARGVRPGDRVVLVLEHPGDFVRAFWACILGGGVPAPMAPPPRRDTSHPTFVRLLAVVERLERPWVVTTESLAEVLEQQGLRAVAVSSLSGAEPAAPVVATPQSPAVVSFTSGSTGRPKGIVLTHHNLLVMGEGMVAGGWILPGDLVVGWMPLDHVASICNPHLSALRVGVPQVLVARDHILAEPLRWLDLLTEFRGTFSWAPNFAYGLVADRLERGERRSWDLSHVRTLMCGGEPVLPVTMQRFVEPLRAVGLTPEVLSPAWGMAETSSYFTCTRGVRSQASEHATALGPPFPGGALRVVDDADVVVPVGTVGHLQVRGEQVLAGYLEDGDLNARSFTRDGWFRTGDLAVLDGDQMCIAGRQKEILIIHGQNVYPQDIEVVVESVPGVLASYTVACPTRGEDAGTDEIVLFFVPTPDAPPLPELLRTLRERVARALSFQVAHWVPVEKHQVPRTELGKRGRTEMRRQFETGGLTQERRRAVEALGGPDAMPACLAVARWLPRPQRELSGATRGPVVVVAPESLVVALRAESPSREFVSVKPGDVAGLGHALESLRARGVRCEDVVVAVGASSVAGSDSSPPSSDALSAVVAPVLRALQTLAPWAERAPVRLWAVATRAENASSPEAAAMLVPGLLWSGAAEIAGLTPRMLWMPSDAREAARCVARELLHPDAAREVSWRDGSRWERAFSPWQPPALTTPRRLKRGGLYLVTGAQGGLGRAWARLLRRGLEARLVLVGRRPAAEGAEDSEPGAALYFQADVTDAAAVREAVRRAEAHFGQPCDGAFHLAGTLGSTPLADESPEGLVRGGAAHVRGALAVAEALRERPEAVLVFTASLMGTLGAGLHAGYCAASGFIERLAEQLVADGRSAVAVSLSQVRDTGMARSVGAAPPGYRVLEPKQALAALSLAAEHGPAHLLAGVEARAWPWRKAGLGTGGALDAAHVFIASSAAGSAPDALGLSPAVVPHVVATLPRSADGAVDREALRARARGEETGRPLGLFETVVSEAFREVLGAPGVGAATDFFSLGGSSLMANRVVARINDRTGLRLRPAALFEHPTAAALAAHVRQVVDPAELDVSSLTDAQVDLLLRALAPA
ncbi:SDR family NAD(P)-dependent oxidoreductase [Myxococcaceae bacterium JPH2]|nr:SDR family NAD(P)-dependent oxidoreductase [Myxococcaceae bacterium JPH2]